MKKNTANKIGSVTYKNFGKASGTRFKTEDQPALAKYCKETKNMPITEIPVKNTAFNQTLAQIRLVQS